MGCGASSGASILSTDRYYHISGPEAFVRWKRPGVGWWEIDSGFWPSSKVLSTVVQFEAARGTQAQLLKEGATIVSLATTTTKDAEMEEAVASHVEEQKESLFQRIVRQSQRDGSLRELDSTYATGTETLRVVVRCRPLSRSEKTAGREVIVKMFQTTNQVLLSSQAKPARGRKKAKPKVYDFDVAMGAKTTQNEVYDHCGRSSES